LQRFFLFRSKARRLCLLLIALFAVGRRFWLDLYRLYRRRYRRRGPAGVRLGLEIERAVREAEAEPAACCS